MGGQPDRAANIFDVAVELGTAAERSAYLDAACGADAQLRAEVEGLLEHDKAAGCFLNLSARPNQQATVDEPALGERPGTVVGSYKLLEQIGEGGFGVVFMAEQQQPVRRKVALKVLKPGMDSRQVTARFEAERQALALMDHPNIATVLDGGTTGGGRPYFVMELVKGVPITDFCDQARLSVPERLGLFVSVSQAVQHAHQKGIIHRDLKPSNVLVTLHDGTPLVKVIDFGIAKALGQQLTDKTLFTGFAQLIGTPLYMSPEQAALSNVDVDTRSDVYALGVLLYELLTGTTPFSTEQFQGADFDEIRRIIREEEPPRPSTRLSTMGQAAATVSTRRQSDSRRLCQLFRGELDWVVMKCLEKDRNRRYESAGALARDVGRYLDDEPVQACPPSAWYRLGKFARRNKTALVIAGLVLLFVVSAGVVAGWLLRDRAAREAEVAHRTRDSVSRIRTLLTERKLPLAYQELAEAKGRLSDDHTRLPQLVQEQLDAVEAELQALAATLATFQRFVGLVEQAHEVEFPPPLTLPLLAGGSKPTAVASRQPNGPLRDPAKAVPFLLEALSCYAVLEQDDWTARLEGGLLRADQVQRVRRTAYEELLWLADEMLPRRADPVSGLPLSQKEAAGKALAYLTRAEPALRPTSAFYQLRGRCRRALGQEAEARQDGERALRTPAAIALDYYLLGLAAYDAKNKSEATNHFESALRVEPTHYMSLFLLGDCSLHLGNTDQDFALAAAAFTGCVLKRPDFAAAYNARGVAYAKGGHDAKAEVEFQVALRLRPDFAAAHCNLSDLLYRQGKHAEAEAAAREALSLQSDLAGAHNSLGAALWKQGRLTEAEAENREALRLQPDRPVAHTNLGVVLCDQGKHAEAEAEHRAALRLQPDFPLAHSNLSGALERQGKLAEAEAEAREALRLARLDPYAHLNLGNALHRQGRHTQAVQEYREALRLRPEHAEAHYDLGNVLRELGKVADAIAEYREALRLRPDLSEAHCNLASALIDQRKYPEAEAASREALRLKPNDPAAHSNLGVALLRQGKLAEAEAVCREGLRLRSDLPDLHVNLGGILNTQGKHAEAVAACREALRLRPDDANAHLNLGGALYILGKVAEAEAEERTALRLRPDLTSARVNLGVILNGQGKLAEAEAEYREALRLRPDDADAHSNLSDCLCQQGKVAEAEAEARAALRLMPFYPEAHNNLGNALDAQGKVAEAVQEYREALRLRPEYPEAHNNLGKALLELGKVADAIAECREALRLRPKYPEAYVNLGNALYKQGKVAEAEAACREVLRLKPDDPAAHLNLGSALNKQGKPAEAETHYREALRLRPESPEAHLAHYGLGNALRDQGKLDEAEAEYRKAIRLRPDYAEAHCNLGTLLGRQGRFAEGLGPLKRGHELGSKQPNWHYPSAEWVRRAEKLAALDAKLPAVLQGKAQPADAEERLGLARLCQDFRKRYATAARFYAEAFAAEPKLAENLRAQDRYNAACAAALAAAGQGEDAGKLEDKERRQLRRQALDWLRADLAAWGQLLEKGADEVQQTLRHWQQDSDFAGMRGDSLVKLPEEERQPWQQLWADVERTLKKANLKVPKSTKRDSSD
jgi:tetratricopeptide (TPR) repeat protein/serine/threonine protein kinase